MRIDISSRCESLVRTALSSRLSALSCQFPVATHPIGSRSTQLQMPRFDRRDRSKTWRLRLKAWNLRAENRWL